MPRHAAILRTSAEVDAASSIRTILDLGFDGLGLEHPLTAHEWNAMRDVLPRERVVSVELFLPYPRSMRCADARPFSPASLHPEERRDAVQQGIETIIFAERQAIPFVRIEPVRLDGDLREALVEIRRSGTLVPERIARLESTRKVEAARRLDSLRSLLSKLLDAADRYGVRIALTPGGFIDELPGVGESAELLRELRGAPLCLCPDTLRAEAAKESATSGETLEALRDAIAGATIRDFTGEREPVSPGGGSMNLEAARAWCESASVWIVDPVSRDDAGALEEGRKLLQSLGGTPEPPPKPGFRLM
jgi:hypothetical protein